MNRKLISILSGFAVLIITYLLSTLIMSKDEETYNKNTNIVHSVRTIKTSNTSNAIAVKVNGTMSAKYKVDLFSQVQWIVINSKKDFKVGQQYNKKEVLLETSSPLMKIWPDDGFSKPAINLSKVLFPQPELPRIDTFSPSLISRLISFKEGSVPL